MYLDLATVTCNGVASWMLALSSTFSTHPQLEKAVLNGFFSLHPFPRLFVYFAFAGVVEYMGKI
jgi:hypothetical protein